MEKTVTILGETYQLKFKERIAKSGGQLTDRLVYQTSIADEIVLDTNSEKLLFFNQREKYRDDVHNEQLISEEQAVQIADSFFHTQCNAAGFELSSVKYEELYSAKQYTIVYMRKHLGLEAERVTICVSNLGHILSYSANLDTDNIIFKVQHYDMDLIRTALEKASESSEVQNISILNWTISENNRPALRVTFNTSKSDSLKGYIVEINENGAYNAYNGNFIVYFK